jgi:hypothetical protein
MWNVWMAGVRTGKCYRFTKGDLVIVVEQALFQNMTRIKKVGETRDYWIPGQPE